MDTYKAWQFSNRFPTYSPPNIVSVQFQEESQLKPEHRVSFQGDESLWGDFRFIPVDFLVVYLCYFALFEDFSL